MASGGSDNAITEEVIRRRLLIDGDGMGDERKLNTLMRSFLTLFESDDTEENDAAAMRRFTGQIKQMEYVAGRTVESIRMNESGKELYDELGEKVKAEIVETKRQIEESKALLSEATKHRKYSMEYDALAKLIGSKPDRILTENKRKALEKDMAELTKRKETLDNQLDARKRSVSMLSSTIELLRELNASEDSYSHKSMKSGRRLTDIMDMDSTSTSEPASPMDVQNSLESSKGSKEPESKIENGSSSIAANSTEKLKSEKYEDLSESDGDEHS